MQSAEDLQTILLSNLEATDRFGDWLSAHLPGGTCLALVGTLGAGKTRLAQAIIAAEGIDRAEVTSPTFALLRSYRGTRHTLHHLDAYRVNDDDEFLDLGVEELWEDGAALVLIEWATRVADCLPKSALWLDIQWSSSEQRVVTLAGTPQLWKPRLAGLREEFPSP